MNRRKEIPIKRFSIDVVLTKVLCFLILVLFIVVSFSKPVAEEIDFWMRDPIHQLETVLFLLLSLTGYWIYWAYRKN